MMQITGRSLNGAPLFQQGAIKIAVTSRKELESFEKPESETKYLSESFLIRDVHDRVWNFARTDKSSYTDRIPRTYNRPTKHKCHILRVHSDKLNALSTGLNFHYYCLQPLIYLPLPSIRRSQ